MSRLHLFEFEDQAWFPARIRNYMVEFLSFMAGLAGDKPFAPFVERLAPAIHASQATRIVELAAGAGGPGVAMARCVSAAIGRPVGLVLTDLYPDVERFRALSAEGVTFIDEPVDATAVPADLHGFRFICNAFHHFREDAGRALLADAVARRQGIAVLELVERSPGGLVQVGVGVLVMLLCSPFVRPFSFGRLFFTYVVPVVPVATAWDGVVSALRIYSPDELRQLISTVPGSETYEWKIEAIRVLPAPARATLLIGVPQTSAR